MKIHAVLLTSRAQLEKVIATVMLIASEAWFAALITVDTDFQPQPIAVKQIQEQVSFKLGRTNENCSCHNQG